MKIIACLGNPGSKYKLNRHNIGFILGEYIADELSILLNGKKFSSVYGIGKYNSEDIMLIFPQTYMNNSGESVSAALKYYKSSSNDLIVIHDELELPFGDFRHKKDGGHKGHNGIRSIIQHLGTADFHRLRFGIGRPENSRYSVADYVLSNFTNDEMSKIKDVSHKIKEEIFKFL